MDLQNSPESKIWLTILTLYFLTNLHKLFCEIEVIAFSEFAYQDTIGLQ